MGLPNVHLDTELKVIQCGTCGVWHAIPQAMFDTCYQEGGYWHCPNGHSRGYSESSIRNELEKEKKRRKLAEENAQRARDEHPALMDGYILLKENDYVATNSNDMPHSKASNDHAQERNKAPT